MLEKLKVALKEKVWDHENVVQLRQKFNELDSQVQSYLIIGSFCAFLLFLAATVLFAFFQNQGLKTQIIENETLLATLQQTSAKIAQIKAQEQENRLVDPIFRDLDPTASPQTFLEKALQKSKISKTSAESIEEKGSKVDVKLSKISLKQLVRLLYYIEHSNAGARVDRLKVETRDDPEGYLWSNLTLLKESS